MVPDNELDLRFLTSDALVISQRNYYIRTEAPDQLHEATDADIASFELLDSGDAQALSSLRDAWRVRIHGEVSEDINLPISRFDAEISSLGATMMECAGNDEYSNFRLMSSAHWDGLRFADFLALLGTSFAPTTPLATPTHVKLSGFDATDETRWNRFLAVESTPGASWIFSIEELLKQGAFFATRMQGEALALDHGFPIRLVVPGYYGCTCIKWLNDIEFMSVDAATETTDQMREFSDRTNQDGVPLLLSEHLPPVIDQALTPIKIEEWELEGESYLRVIGLMWGGTELQPTISLGVKRDEVFGYGPLQELGVHSPPSSESDAFTLWWSDWWKPAKAGKYVLDPQFAGASTQIPARRQQSGYYRRGVRVRL